MQVINKILIGSAINLAIIGASQAHEIYAKGGFLGVGGGYSYSINDYFGVRGEYTKFSTDLNDESAGKFVYDAQLKSDHKSLYFDYFPFGGTFRLTAGLAKRDFGMSVNGYADEHGIYIGNTWLGKSDINKYKAVLGVNDDVSATGEVKWKKTAPYLGLGWGHGSGKGFGFVADIGVYMGKATAKLKANDALYKMLDVKTKYDNANFTKRNEIATAIDSENKTALDTALNGISGSANDAINAQIAELDDDVKDLKLIPALHLGISYRF